MDSLWQALNKLLDNFNLGRSIIYTLAGTLFLLPLWLLARIPFDPSGATLAARLSADLSVLGRNLAPALIFAYLAGMALAAAVYPMISAQQEAVVAQLPRGRESVSAVWNNLNYNFRLLATERPALDWLISEYFRFVEVVVYLPVAALAGLLLSGLWAALLVPALGKVALTLCAGLLMIFLALLLMFRQLWVPKVILPTIGAYVMARNHLIMGLRHAADEPEKHHAD